MRKDKDKAIKLRRSGLSYNQIAVDLDIPKSTLSYWLKDIELTAKALNKLKKRSNIGTDFLILRNKQQTQLAIDRHNQILKDSEKSFLKYKKEILFISGVALYWGEGYKKGATGSSWKAIDLANSDSEMVNIFLKFLKRYLIVKNEDISLQLIIAPNQDINKAIRFWSKITKLKNRFIKTYSKVSKASKGKRDKNSLPYGTIHIRVNNVEKFFILIGWINCLKKYNIGV